MKRIAWIAAVLGILGAVGSFGILNRKVPPEKPYNLVVILVDTMRADHLGFMDYVRPTSPQLDRLAAESVVFEHHMSNASRTGPSVATLFTGLNPPSNGVINPLTLFDAKGTLSEDRTTLAEILHDRGYFCVGFTANLNVSERFGFGQGFDIYEWIRPTGDGSGLGGPASAVNAAALTWMKDATTPFFLYLHYLDPHSPYDAPPPHDRLFVDPGYKGPFNGSHRQLDEVLAGTMTADDADVRHLVSLYDQEIAHADALIGELLDSMREADMLEHTVVVLVSDHGEEFFDHGSVLHGYTLYREQLHIPLVIRDPRRPGPIRVESMTRQVDVLPTLLDLLGTTYDGRIEGRSLVGLMSGGKVEEATPPLYAMASLKAVETVQRQAILSDRWKLIESTLPESKYELYDTLIDPGEEHDLSAEDPPLFEAMKEALSRMRESFADAPTDTVSLTDEERERLRSVGYIQ